MPYRRIIGALLLLLFAATAGADGLPAAGAGRGELLYQTHCVGCHSEQVHWRDRKLATDWITLQAEVRRWQDASRLGWSDSEIADVARYLNRTHYRYALPESRAALDTARLR